jgi:hypothetical protein
MHKSESTVGNGVFYGGPCQGVIRRTTGARIGSWEGAAIQRGLQPGSSGIAIAMGWKRLSVCNSELYSAENSNVIMSCVLKWSINPISNPKLCQESLIHVTIFTSQLKIMKGEKMEK